MDLKIIFEPINARAAAYDGRTEIGEATYSASPETWILDHTYVDDNYRGNGIARKLVDKVVDEARRADVKVLPLCPYAAALFKEEPETYRDIASH
ncbi:MAG: GNAT family N-acetyltransferase [Coriobacteriia bacterium]|nr:GNAT family N-acetyltransferase [Coriobacteriia bacterium]